MNQIIKNMGFDKKSMRTRAYFWNLIDVRCFLKGIDSHAIFFLSKNTILYKLYGTPYNSVMHRLW